MFPLLYSYKLNKHFAAYKYLVLNSLISSLTYIISIMLNNQNVNLDTFSKYLSSFLWEQRSGWGRVGWISKRLRSKGGAGEWSWRKHPRWFWSAFVLSLLKSLIPGSETLYLTVWVPNGRDFSNPKYPWENAVIFACVLQFRPHTSSCIVLIRSLSHSSLKADHGLQFNCNVKCSSCDKRQWGFLLKSSELQWAQESLGLFVKDADFWV